MQGYSIHNKGCLQRTGFKKSYEKLGGTQRMEQNDGSAGKGTSERVPKLELLDEIVYRVIENIEKRGGSPELPTGIHAVDSGTYGLHPTHLMVISGRPGEGKTSLCVQMAYNLAKIGKRVAYFSLEMTKETLVERLFCNIFNISSREIRLENSSNRDFDLFKETILRKAIEFGTECKNKKIPIHFIDDWGHIESEFFHLFERLNYNPEVIFFDHIQEIRPERGANKYEALDSYLRYLKLLSMQKKIAVVVVSQINRQGDENPSMANLKGCLHGDTLIGGKKIKQIFMTKDFSKIKSFDLKKSKLLDIKPSDLLNTGIRKCLKIKTRSGKEIIVSSGTKLFDGQVWRQARSFRAGQKIRVEFL